MLVVVMTDILTTWAEVIIRVRWRVVVGQMYKVQIKWIDWSELIGQYSRLYDPNTISHTMWWVSLPAQHFLINLAESFFVYQKNTLLNLSFFHLLIIYLFAVYFQEFVFFSFGKFALLFKLLITCLPNNLRHLY